jgi:hypothetical protein
LDDTDRSDSLTHDGKFLHSSKKILHSLLKPIKHLLNLLLKCVINLPDFLQGLVLEIIKLLIDFHNLLSAKKPPPIHHKPTKFENIRETAIKLETLLDDLLGALNSITSLGGCIKPIKKSIKPALNALRLLNSRNIG